MTVVVFSALVIQVVDFLRDLASWRTQRSAIVTQLTAWVGGVLLVWLGAHAAVTSKLVLPGADRPLGVLDFASVVILGLLVASLGSTVVDVKAALDNTDSAKQPPLIPPPGPTVPAEAPAVPVAPANVYLMLNTTSGAPPAV